jgi:flagellar motility protein MotE (MotC chaperone)
MKRRLQKAIRTSLTSLARLAGIAVVAAPIAFAQQAWEPTVTKDGADRKAPPLPRLKAAQAVPATIVPVPADEKAAAAKAGPAVVVAKEIPPAARDYCTNIVDAAADARVAWQRKLLKDAGADIDKRIAMLDEKTNEYRKWLARRDDFIKKANETVVSFYGNITMKVDAAALQIAALDEETAAAILTKLDSKRASAILNNMEPTHAAKLTATIIGSGKIYPAPARHAKVEADE